MMFGCVVLCCAVGFGFGVLLERARVIALRCAHGR